MKVNWFAATLRFNISMINNNTKRPKTLIYLECKSELDKKHCSENFFFLPKRKKSKKKESEEKKLNKPTFSNNIL